MAKTQIQAKDRADLEFQQNEAEKKKVGLVEGVFVVLFTVFSDLVEFFVPILSWLITMPIAGAIILWALMRGLHGRFWLKKAIGKIIDYLLGGIFPIATIVIVVLIWLNNRTSNKIIQGIMSTAGRVL